MHKAKLEFEVIAGLLLLMIFSFGFIQILENEKIPKAGSITPALTIIITVLIPIAGLSSLLFIFLIRFITYVENRANKSPSDTNKQESEPEIELISCDTCFQLNKFSNKNEKFCESCGNKLR